MRAAPCNLAVQRQAVVDGAEGHVPMLGHGPRVKLYLISAWRLLWPLVHEGPLPQDERDASRETATSMLARADKCLQQRHDELCRRYGPGNFWRRLFGGRIRALHAHLAFVASAHEPSVQVAIIDGMLRRRYVRLGKF